jgi:hypothetical protein
MVMQAGAQELYDEAFVIGSSADDRRKSNMAGRQVMLVDRMVENACFMHLGVEPELHAKRLQQAQFLFGATEAALKDGNPALHLKKERNTRVLEALAEVDRAYAPFNEVIAAIVASGAVTVEQLAFLDDSTRSVENAMARVVRMIDSVYLQKNYSMKFLVALDFVSNERVTSQAIVKDFCLIGAGVHADVKKIELEDEVAVYEGRLMALRDGEPLVGLPPAPNDAIVDQINTALALWTEIAPTISLAYGREKLGHVQLEQVARHATPMLASVNQAVYMFEGLE